MARDKLTATQRRFLAACAEGKDGSASTMAVGCSPSIPKHLEELGLVERKAGCYWGWITPAGRKALAAEAQGASHG